MIAIGPAHDLELSPKHRAELARAYEAACPLECCGVLLGCRDGPRSIVYRVVTTLNAVSTVGGFAIPDHEIRRVRWLAEQAGLSILAVFHSHPSGSTEPSSTDRAALEYEEWPWVILTESAVSGELLLTWCNQST